jgi:hypothetical protein
LHDALSNSTTHIFNHVVDSLPAQHGNLPWVWARVLVHSGSGCQPAFPGYHT